jgi:hypothetical protein
VALIEFAFGGCWRPQLSFLEGEGLDAREARLRPRRGLEKQDKGEADSRALRGGAMGCRRVFSIFM